MDIVGSLICIVLFSPVMLITAVLIKLTSPGPLIFTQERVGLHNVPFRMYKFRSMEVQTQSEEKKGWTVKNDPRVTPVGRFIRKTSIDELPQFWNVLKGDMSLVEPDRRQWMNMSSIQVTRSGESASAQESRVCGRSADEVISKISMKLSSWIWSILITGPCCWI